MATQKRGYTLSDRGTYIAFRKKSDLVVVRQGDTTLWNPYGIIAVNPKKYAHVKYDLAMKLVEFVTGPEGRSFIAGYKVDGEQLFFVTGEGRIIKGSPAENASPARSVHWRAGRRDPSRSRDALHAPPGRGVSRADRIGLLEAIDRCGSITGAARAVGISYKTAWDAVDAMNNAAEKPLVRRAAGAPARWYNAHGRGKGNDPALRVLQGEHQRFIGRLEGRLGTWAAFTPCFGGSPCESARGTCSWAR